MIRPVNPREKLMKMFPWMAHMALKVVDVRAGMNIITGVTMDTTVLTVMVIVRSGQVRTLPS